METERRVSVVLRITPKHRERLRRLAAQTQRSQSALMRAVLEGLTLARLEHLVTESQQEVTP